MKIKIKYSPAEKQDEDRDKMLSRFEKKIRIKVKRKCSPDWKIR